LLKNESATREAFLREAGRHSIVHVSAHALLNPDHPHLSLLLLASDGEGDPGTLTAAEIESLSLPETQLVFLASCRSGGGSLASEGVLSLARSFLAAGAPEVVSSLWNLDDQSAATLMLEFYTRILAGADAQKALQQMQLAALRGPGESGSLRVWAALQILTGKRRKQN
jgi:CHAT domain-containing protein